MKRRAGALRSRFMLAAAVSVLIGVCSVSAEAETITSGMYTASNEVAYDWIDIAATGTAMAQNQTGAESMPVSLGFDFMYGGRTYSQVYVSSVGALRFDDHLTSDYNMDLPTGNRDLVSVYWDDLYYGPASTVPSNAVYYQTLGTEGNRQFIVQWQDADHYHGGNGAITFQAILNEADNTIKFQYQDATFENTPSLSGGASATVGLQTMGRRSQTSAATKWSYNTAALSDGEAILFQPYNWNPSPPVSLTLTYTAAADAYAYAQAYQIGIPVESENSQQAYATDPDIAMAETYAFVNGDSEYPGAPEPMMYEVSTYTSAQIGGEVYDGMPSVESYFSISNAASGPGDGYGEAKTSLVGELTVGTSDAFPAGAGGLTLLASAGRDEADWYWSLVFSCRLVSTDPDNPFDITLDADNLSAEIAVLAGQVIQIEYTHNLTSNYATEYGWVDFTIVPEPATLGLFAICSTALLRRKRRRQ